MNTVMNLKFHKRKEIFGQLNNYQLQKEHPIPRS